MQSSCQADVIRAHCPHHVECHAGESQSHMQTCKPCVGGIVHAGGILQDGSIGQQGLQGCRAVWGPKVASLAALTDCNSPLGSAVVFSSIAAAFGSAGQVSPSPLCLRCDSVPCRAAATAVPVMRMLILMKQRLAIQLLQSICRLHPLVLRMSHNGNEQRADEVHCGAFHHASSVNLGLGVAVPV